MVTYPISKGRIINVVGLVFDPDGEGTTYEGPSVRAASREEVLKYYIDWEPEVLEILKVRGWGNAIATTVSRFT